MIANCSIDEDEDSAMGKVSKQAILLVPLQQLHSTSTVIESEDQVLNLFPLTPSTTPTETDPKGIRIDIGPVLLDPNGGRDPRARQLGGKA